MIRFLIPALNCLQTSFLHSLLTSLFISFRIGPFRFLAGGRKRRSNLGIVFVFILCYSVFCYGCMFAFVVLDFVY